MECFSVRPRLLAAGKSWLSIQCSLSLMTEHALLTCQCSLPYTDQLQRADRLCQFSLDARKATSQPTEGSGLTCSVCSQRWFYAIGIAHFPSSYQAAHESQVLPLTPGSRCPHRLSCDSLQGRNTPFTTEEGALIPALPRLPRPPLWARELGKGQGLALHSTDPSSLPNTKGSSKHRTKSDPIKLLGGAQISSSPQILQKLSLGNRTIAQRVRCLPEMWPT